MGYAEQEVVDSINRAAFENLTRKLNEANARIVEFEQIKLGHLARVRQLEEALSKISDVTSAIEYGKRNTSYMDWELRRIAREALEVDGES